MLSEDAAACDLEAYSSLLERLICFECSLADEVRLVHLYCEVETCCSRADVIIEFMAVERHCSFHSERVSCAECAWDESVILTCSDESFPDVSSLVCRHVDLESVLACVACTGDHYRDSLEVCIEDACIVACRDVFLVNYFLEYVLGIRTLEGNLTVLIANIRELYTVDLVIAHPCEVLVCVSSIDYYEVVVLGLHIYNEVIDGTAVLIAHRGVSCESRLKVCVIVCQEQIEEVLSLLTLNENFAHVGNVEQSALSSDCHVLCFDTCSVLYRKKEAAEFDYLAAVLKMGIIERGFLFHRCIPP